MEYALVLGLVSIAAITLVIALGPAVAELFESVLELIPGT